MVMAVRNEFDEYQFALRRRSDRHAKDSVSVASGSAAKETLVETVMTLCGIVGVFLLVFVCVQVMGYN